MIEIIAIIALFAVAFALVYIPWPKSKQTREQQTIAEYHFQKALEAWRMKD
ncbi:MAG TPA: hypothetical protein VKA31_00335 [Mariprofundaceae bacterium]|nr:hypothetical protein [Mariprofundaceae bacterium]